MKEVILKIEETTWYNGSYEGYIITTNKQTIQVGVSNGQQCCENYGYLSSNDDLEDYTGAELLSIRIVDESMVSCEILNNLYDGGAIFINIETSKGVLQIVAYNSHNGYYGHQVKVISNQLDFNDVI